MSKKSFLDIQQQAFPGQICVGHTKQGNEETPIYMNPPGMGLHDYFAAKAMQAMLTGSVGVERFTHKSQISVYAKGPWNGALVQRAFDVADEMMAERERRLMNAKVEYKERADERG